MVRLLNKYVQKPGFYIRSALCILIPAVGGRALELLYLYLSAGGETSELSLSFVRWGYLLFWCISTAAALTLIAAAIYTSGTKCAAHIMGIFVLCRAAESVTRYLTQGYGTNEHISKYAVILSAVTYISDFLFAVALAFGAWILSAAFRKACKHHDRTSKYSLKSAVNAAILLMFSAPFARLILRAAVDAVASNWQPSVMSIRSFVIMGVETFVFYAIIAFIGSRITLAVCTKREF